MSRRWCEAVRSNLLLTIFLLAAWPISAGTAVPVGIDFDLEYFPREGITLIVFGNRGAPAFDTLRRNVTRLITGDR